MSFFVWQAQNEQKGVVMIKQNDFSRTLANEKKMGAYYTDLDHCRRLGRLFSWPDDPVCVLEPSCGDGSAVRAVTQSAPNVTIFGVELNPQTADELKENARLDYVIAADYLNGTKISRKKFSFCFANPPYGYDAEGKKRYEREFVERIFLHMKEDGVMALVIPYYILTDVENFFKSFFSRFEPVRAYRFDDAVYQQFKQVVVIAQKRSCIGYFKEDLPKYIKKIDEIGKLPYLPEYSESIDFPISIDSSEPGEIEYFTTLAFDAEEASSHLKSSTLFSLLEKRCQKTYMATDIGHPPVPLKKDLLYICAVSGGGQGLVGSTEKGDVHLQRGVVRVEKKNECILENGIQKTREISRAQMSLKIIENSGKITTLS